MIGLVASMDAQTVLSALTEYSNMRSEAVYEYQKLQSRAMEMVDSVR
eukprot:SAG31_NODE_27267_length_429_cov_0.615152_1_plen_46_part_10